MQKCSAKFTLRFHDNSAMMKERTADEKSPAEWGLIWKIIRRN